MPLVIFPVPLVLVAACPRVGALAMLLAIHEVPLVLVAARPHVGALAMLLVILPVPLVLGAVRPRVGALAMHRAVPEVAIVDVARIVPLEHSGMFDSPSFTISAVNCQRRTSVGSFGCGSPWPVEGDGSGTARVHSSVAPPYEPLLSLIKSFRSHSWGGARRKLSSRQDLLGLQDTQTPFSNY